MDIIVRKRALNAIVKTALFVESLNTPGSGERWAEKIKSEIISLADSKAKFSLCRHPSLAKHQYCCYVFKDWVIVFRIHNNEFEFCRFIHGSRLA
ncbi:MAG: type II toxin-antitoxin system RelE/ParE family toxin [Bacteroidetes bacterium]|nr:type II toxin-antitoxin system RelE/ParE family toxin [Bacteroidota bacterium]